MKIKRIKTIVKFNRTIRLYDQDDNIFEIPTSLLKDIKFEEFEATEPLPSPSFIEKEKNGEDEDEEVDALLKKIFTSPVEPFSLF